MHADQLSDSKGANLVARFGGLSADHLEYACEEGIRAMALKGAVAVLLPGAFYFLRETRLPPMEALRRHGVPIALATDCNRSEEHTSELQSLMRISYAVFCLKKKKLRPPNK